MPFPSWVFNLDGTPVIVPHAEALSKLPGSDWSFVPFVSRHALDVPMPNVPDRVLIAQQQQTLIPTGRTLTKQTPSKDPLKGHSGH
jgi:hypothetical protein